MGHSPLVCSLSFAQKEDLTPPAGSACLPSAPQLHLLLHPSSHMERKSGNTGLCPCRTPKRPQAPTVTQHRDQPGQPPPAEPAVFPGKLRLSPYLPPAWDPSLFRTALLLRGGEMQKLFCSQKRGYFPGALHLSCSCPSLVPGHG